MAGRKAKVAVLKTDPEKILDSYSELMHLGRYEQFISKDVDTLIKLNLSWTKYFPACSSQPWQLEGLVRTMLDDGFSKERLFKDIEDLYRTLLKERSEEEVAV